MLTAGQLRHRIFIERAAPINDAFTSEAQLVWTGIGTVWADVTPLSDGEQWRAKQLGATATHRIRVRYTDFISDITPNDRVRFGTRIMNITGIKPLGPSLKEGFEITATEEV